MEIEILGVKIDKSVLTTYWDCNVKVCGGQCCCIDPSNGDTDDNCGAIVLDNEVKGALDAGITFISQAKSTHKCFIQTKKSVVKLDCFENFTTRMHKGECVFRGDKGCILATRKPLLCSIFPLDYSDDGVLVVADHDIQSKCHECRKLGEENKILLIDSIKANLIGVFGKKFYDELKAASDNALSGSNR